ncbi:shikimate 5-dehydrogenase [Pseudohyphozyma bogoriensis]|nr:shikimate 5-dehydrogenase [Pseudohyphozyma bogoriensis]
MTIDPTAFTEEKKTYLFGYPLKRTYAPFLHNTITTLAGVKRSYAKLESTDMDMFKKLIRQPDFGGSAVTMPHKVAICKELDGLTEDGAAIGACNTILREFQPDGSIKLIGHNTDSVGVRESLLKQDDSHVKSGKVRPGMLFGAGGAARASIYAMHKWLNCSPIYVVNRDAAEVETLIADYKKNATPAFDPVLVHIKTPEEAAKYEAPAYIVSAVPAFPPTTPEEKEARATVVEIFKKPEKGVILEMCYFPHPWTELAQIAQDAGWQVVTGEQAMIWQGIEQQKLWLGAEEKDFPIEKVFATVKEQLASDAKTGNEPPTGL